MQRDQQQWHLLLQEGTAWQQLCQQHPLSPWQQWRLQQLQPARQVLWTLGQLLQELSYHKCLRLLPHRSLNM